MQNIANDLLSKSVEEIAEHPCVPQGRADILAGGAVLFSCLMQTLNIEKITVRAVTEPPTSVVIKGPREGFNESLKYNLAMIRRRAKSEDLVVETLELGKLTKTQIAVVYFNSIADK